MTVTLAYLPLYEALQELQRTHPLVCLCLPNDPADPVPTDVQEAIVRLLEDLPRVRIVAPHEPWDVWLQWLPTATAGQSAAQVAPSEALWTGPVDARGALALLPAPAAWPAYRILVLTNLYPPQELGGYGRSIHDFAVQLRRNGHTIRVLTSDAPYLGAIAELEPEVDRSLQLLGSYEGGVSLLEDRTEARRRMLANRQRLQEQIATFQPDVCLLGNLDLLLVETLEPLQQAQIPLVHHLGFAQLPYALEQRPTSPLYRLVANSRYSRQQLQQAGYSAPIDVVYPGACCDTYTDLPIPVPGTLRIAFASLLMPVKGAHVLLEALDLLKQQGIPFKAHIAGKAFSRDYAHQLEQFCREQGLTEQVQFHGYLERPQLRQLLAECNTFVFPSTWEEPFGISQVEGMAAGLATISSGTGGAAEVVEHDVSGLRFEPGNARSLAETLTRLATEPGLMSRLARAGRQRAVEVFDIRHSVAQLEAIFAELLALKAEPQDDSAAVWSLPVAAPLSEAKQRQLRQRLTRLWQALPQELLAPVYAGPVGDLQRRLLAGDLPHQPLTEAEQQTRAQLRQMLQAGLAAPGALNAFLALMLHCSPTGLRVEAPEQHLPDWLLADYRRCFEAGAPESITIF